MPQLPDRVYLGMEYDCVYIYAFPTATQAIAWSNAEDEVPRYIWSVDTADARSYRVEVTRGTYLLVEVGPRFAPSLDLAALRRRLGPARSTSSTTTTGMNRHEPRAQPGGAMSAPGGSGHPSRIPEGAQAVSALTVFVPGTPVPQGSTRAFVRGHRAIVTADNAKTKPWRADVQATVRNAVGPAIAISQGPVRIGLSFVMPRRKAEPKRITPPHTRKPDLDKLTRAILDALSGLVYTDDSQVAEVQAKKRTAAVGEQPGVWIGWEPA